jgi:O-antigen/teichoic acid export membrane protein
MGVQSVAPFLLLILYWKRGLFRVAHLGAATVAEIKPLLSQGIVFLQLQVGVAVGVAADTLIISSILGPSDVAEYSVAQRLFQFVTIPLAAINAPMWAAYADARARGDHGFTAKTLKRSLIFTGCVSGVVSLLLLTFYKPIVFIWTDGTIQLSHVLVLAFAVWAASEALGNSFAIYLNGLSILRPQLVLVYLSCFVILPLKIAFTAMFGIQGVLLAAILGFWGINVIVIGVIFRAAVFSPLKERGRR